MDTLCLSQVPSSQDPLSSLWPISPISSLFQVLVFII